VLLKPEEAAALEAPFLKWLHTDFKARLPNEDVRDFTLAPPSAGSGELRPASRRAPRTCGRRPTILAGARPSSCGRRWTATCAARSASWTR